MVRVGRAATIVFSAVILATFSGCGTSATGHGAGSAQLFKNLGSYHIAIDTQSAEAARYFDEAMVLAYAYNYEEAERSFREAARLDPGLALAWWGVALVNGPHINSPTLDIPHAQVAWTAIEQAKRLAIAAGARDRALIDALATRYEANPTAERRKLDEAYAAAMEKVAAKFPKDPDIGTLWAESLMNLQPWDMWTQDGKPKGNTERIVGILKGVLRDRPDHAGANHLLIHAVEASPSPGDAVASADRLRTLAPGASHLVHMPAHIYSRLGRYADAAASNRQAIAADEEYIERTGSHGFYHFYRAHNYHFLSYNYMMLGRCSDAVAAGREMVKRIPKEFVDENAAFMDGFLPIVQHAQIRFGKWDEILAQPAPPSTLPVSTAFHHYARGIAFSAKGQVTEARAELEKFRAANERVGAEIVIGLNPAGTVLEIARCMLEGELAYREGRKDEAFTLLREGIGREDRLVYDEPPNWLQPVRHALGALLVQEGRVAEAEAVYREDLARWPENGWSLYGLARCLEARAAKDEHAKVAARLAAAWSEADVKLTTSCYCQPWK